MNRYCSECGKLFGCDSTYTASQSGICATCGSTCAIRGTVWISQYKFVEDDHSAMCPICKGGDSD